MISIVVVLAASNLFEQIKDLAVPVALFISLVMQKLASIKATRIADAAEAARNEHVREQKQATEDAARMVSDKLETQNRESERAAQEVKEQLSKSTLEQKIKLEQIHVDVNSKMAAQKKKTWAYADVLARRPDATPEDIANAKQAEIDYIDHMEAQARSDERVAMVVTGSGISLAPPPGSVTSSLP